MRWRLMLGLETVKDRGRMFRDLPGVGAGRFIAGTWEDRIQLRQRLFVEFDIGHVDGILELFHGSRSYDGCGDDRITEKPGQSDCGWSFTDSVTELLVSA